MFLRYLDVYNVLYVCPSLRKPGIWDFFVRVEFYVWLISSTIELTHVQVSDRLCTSLWRYSALFATAPYPQQSRNYGPKALLCTRMAFPHTTRDPETN